MTCREIYSPGIAGRFVFDLGRRPLLVASDWGLAAILGNATNGRGGRIRTALLALGLERKARPVDVGTIIENLKPENGRKSE